MIFPEAASRAAFRPDKMGKTELIASDHLFAGLNAFEPGQTHEPHTHCDRDKLYVVLEGRGELTVGETTCEVGPGAVALAPAGVVHAVHNPGPGRLVVLTAISPPPGP